MADRRSIRLEDNDAVAAAQILSWISRPHRPESAIKVLEHWHWAYQRKLGHDLPALPFELMKPNRIEAQFKKLEADCMAALRAGQWMQWAILKMAPHPWFAEFTKGVSRLAAERVEAGASATSNEMRKWSKRKPVAHLCLSSGNALGRWLSERGLRGFGLSGALREPTWVAEAIEQSEAWARPLARKTRAIGTIRFHRDAF